MGLWVICKGLVVKVNQGNHIHAIRYWLKMIVLEDILIIFHRQSVYVKIVCDTLKSSDATVPVKSANLSYINPILSGVKMHSGLCCMLKIVYWPQPSSDNDNCYTEYFMFWPVALLMLLQQLLTLMYLMWLLRRISLMLALMVLQGKTFSSKHLLCVLF